MSKKKTRTGISVKFPRNDDGTLDMESALSVLWDPEYVSDVWLTVEGHSFPAFSPSHGDGFDLGDLR